MPKNLRLYVHDLFSVSISKYSRIKIFDSILPLYNFNLMNHANNTISVCKIKTILKESLTTI